MVKFVIRGDITSLRKAAMFSVGQLQADTIGLPGLSGLLTLGSK